MINGLGVEVILSDDKYNARGNNFLTVKETLTRVGIPVKPNLTLSQTCHILSKNGKYHILHFKELFEMEGQSAKYNDYDIKRRDAICQVLESWDLFTIRDEIPRRSKPLQGMNLRILRHHEKDTWDTTANYTMKCNLELKD